ncbi:FAD:protein FMN transferase [Aerococcaceae bacterium DSM 111020]|nr:FAD:protein FMN transferase [Aerococcaceae bacterium DSM 111020]
MIALLVISGLIFTGCGATQQATLLEEPYQATEFKMGTYVSLRIYDEDKEAVLDEAFSLVDDLAAKITTNASGSDIDAVNKASGNQPVQVSPEIYPLVEAAYDYSVLPQSGFDMTIGPITDLWRMGFDDARVPKSEEIEDALPLVDAEQVELNEETNEVYLTEEGMKLDLGAIAKGYIADEIKDLFQERGVTTAIIDLGGNVLIMGDSPKREGEGFVVGVQDPIHERGDFIGTLALKDQSIVTSGIYERYLERDGQVYHHLMNPATGYPFDNELLSVTVITPRSLDADALSTVGFGLGLEEGVAFFDDRSDAEAVFITEDLDVYTTDGLKDQFELTNDEFNWVNPD